ncbi:MAG: metal-dependent transcriptional regulator [candidate division Zixibacteria bacterium]|jgi:DtxR family Mn-dependent transcriptional regulator|nr:metal-dependent transcriptional regulator [candidate division Zixibacteria bacterium]
MKITPRIEDYLETVFRLSQKLDTVGVSDVARARKVSVPTARTAINRLQDIGLLHQKHYGKIILHDSGRERAQQIYRVHRTLKRFLTEILQVDDKIAEKEACYMEHGLGKETLRRLTLLLNSLDRSLTRESGFLEKFRTELNQYENDNRESETSGK